MNVNTTEDIRSRLFSMQDTSYRDFHAKLMPTIDKEVIIGVRTPALRAFAKEIAGTEAAQNFLLDLPHRYYEENNLHAFLIEHIKSYDECIGQLDRFLPYVNNWATCDSMVPKVLRRHLPELIEHIGRWIKSDQCYTVRYAIGLLMRFYLDEAFDPKYPAIVSGIVSDEYYVNMMRAWYFATALAKQYDSAVRYLEDGSLDSWTHNRTIQKAVESYRITDGHKAYLRTLRTGMRTSEK